MSSQRNVSETNIEKIKEEVEKARSRGIYILVAVLILVLLGVFIIQTQSHLADISKFSWIVGATALIVSILTLVYTEIKREQMRKLLYDVLDERSSTFTRKELINQLENAVNFAGQTKNLIDSGNFNQAEKIAHQQLKEKSNDVSALEIYISTLLAHNKKEKCEIAWDILKKDSITNLSIYTRLAFLFWNFSEIEKAIEVDEKGLEVAKSKGDKETTNKFKNSLAYFYADTGKEDYENLARLYIEEAYKDQPKNLNRIDTKGYVKIVYGKTKEEIFEGMDLCLQAYKEDTEHFKITYEKHIKKATERLSALGVKS